MGKNAGGRSYDPPVQNFRQKTGNFNAKVGRKENKDTQQQALARKQPDPIPFKKILAFLAIFGAVSAILYAYLTYVLADDEDDFDLPMAQAAAAGDAATAAATPTATPAASSNGGGSSADTG